MGKVENFTVFVLVVLKINFNMIADGVVKLNPTQYVPMLKLHYKLLYFNLWTVQQRKIIINYIALYQSQSGFGLIILKGKLVRTSEYWCRIHGFRCR